MDKLDYIRRCARPVMFETDVPEAAYSIAGTAFLVGFNDSLYIITARHVIRDYPVEKVVVFPWDKSDFSTPLRIADFWNIEDEDHADSELSDLLVIKADLGCIPKRDRRKGQLIFLTPPDATAWFGNRFHALFFLCGHPHEINDVDYAKSEVNTGQLMLTGRYVGPSLAGCHELQVRNPLGISDFSGLSGSPVFSHTSDSPFIPVACSKLHFCGMVLRGTVESCRIHFLSSDAIMEALREIERVKQRGAGAKTAYP